MSKESPPVREVVPFKPGKRQSTFRKLNIDFAGTALEEALARQQQNIEDAEKVEAPELTPLTPVTGVNDSSTLEDSSQISNETPPSTLTPVTPLTPVTRVNEVASTKKQAPVMGVDSGAAPRKDFTRAANSIVRDAIPAGIFTGKGKHLYDYLYSQTRGAITPVHSARIPTEKVMAGAGMTRNTFRFHLERLCNSGLVKVEQRTGEHGGNIYTILLPEEAGLQRGDRGERGDRGYPSHPGENLPLVQGSEVDPSHPGLNPVNPMAYSASNTSFKTKEINTDDEAAPLARALARTERELTGKVTTDPSKWEDLADILVKELRLAAGRTNVTSVPAFLAEHLRRRLWKKDRPQLDAEAAEQRSEPRSPKPDASRCPDCFGAGMYYPEGFDKGVARCSHARLSQEATPES